MTSRLLSRLSWFGSRAKNSSRPGVPASIAIALLIATASVVFQVAVFRARPDSTSDFDQVHAAASAITRAVDPYTVVGPGREYEWKWPLFHPMPTVVAVLPLASLPVQTARRIFVFLGAAAFAYGIARSGGSWARWLVFVSASWQTTVLLKQFSGYLAAAALVPWMGVLLVVKPNIGLAVMAGVRRWRDLAWPIGGGLVLLLASFAIQPDWVARWLHALGSNTNTSAVITRPWGWLLLLAVIKWRRPEARLFLALSCVTQTPHIYDTLLLFLIPVSAVEHIALVILSRMAMSQAFSVGSTNGYLNEWLVWYGELVVYWMYLPCLLMLLLRPNEGPAPAWLERRIARLPAWLRGGNRATVTNAT